MNQSINYKKIVLLDDGDFSFQDEALKPLGGAQTAVIGLVKGFAALGLQVIVRNNRDQDYEDESIDWKKIDLSEKINGDFFIINRVPKLIQLVPKDKPVFLWLHNRCNYLLKWRDFKWMLQYWPTIVYSGKFHRSTFYLWPVFKNRVIP